MIAGQIPTTDTLFTTQCEQSLHSIADHTIAVTLVDALNRPMDVGVMARVIREHIVPFKDGQYEYTDLAVNERTIERIIETQWQQMQTMDTEDTTMVYLTSSDSNAPIFTYATIMVLLGCISNCSVCVLVDGDELCHHIFTIRSLSRQLVDGCATLSIVQFVAILRELSVQLKTVV